MHHLQCDISSSGTLFVSNSHLFTTAFATWNEQKEGRRVTWLESALCRGKTHLFYGEEKGRSAPAKRRQRETIAKSICALCPVIDECLKTALEHDDDFGIWGGLTPNERYEVKYGSIRRRRKPKNAA